MNNWEMNGTGFREWRQNMKLTQAEVADKFQVSRNTIQNWEGSDGPLPIIVQQGCQVWERHIRQTWPDLGPVTLGWADGPTFVSPGERFGMIQSKAFRTNAEALEYVRARWGEDNFRLPFIRYGEFGIELWNAEELRQVVSTARVEP